MLVGVVGFEPTTPCSQSRCANRAALHPDCRFESTARWCRRQRRHAILPSFGSSQLSTGSVDVAVQGEGGVAGSFLKISSI